MRFWCLYPVRRLTSSCPGALLCGNAPEHPSSSEVGGQIRNKSLTNFHCHQKFQGASTGLLTDPEMKSQATDWSVQPLFCMWESLRMWNQLINAVFSRGFLDNSRNYSPESLGSAEPPRHGCLEQSPGVGHRRGTRWAVLRECLAPLEPLGMWVCLHVQSLLWLLIR